MAIKIAVARRNEMLSALIDNANNGKLRIYSGAEPATADTALSGNTQLAELTMNAVSFGAPANGVMTANAITSDPSADAAGTAAFFRVYESDGSTVVYQGTVTATGGGGDLQLATTTLSVGLIVSITSLSLTM